MTVIPTRFKYLDENVNDFSRLESKILSLNLALSNPEIASVCTDMYSDGQMLLVVANLFLKLCINTVK